MVVFRPHKSERTFLGKLLWTGEQDCGYRCGYHLGITGTVVDIPPRLVVSSCSAVKRGWSHSSATPRSAKRSEGGGPAIWAARVRRGNPCCREARVGFETADAVTDVCRMDQCLRLGCRSTSFGNSSRAEGSTFYTLGPPCPRDDPEASSSDVGRAPSSRVLSALCFSVLHVRPPDGMRGCLELPAIWIHFPVGNPYGWAEDVRRSLWPSTSGPGGYPPVGTRGPAEAWRSRLVTNMSAEV